MYILRERIMAMWNIFYMVRHDLSVGERNTREVSLVAYLVSVLGVSQNLGLKEKHNDRKIIKVECDVIFL